MRSKVRVTIVIVRQDGRTGQLTKSEQWDVISSAATTVRAAIEKYVAPSMQAKARKAVAHVLESAEPPASVRTHCREYEIEFEL